MAVTSRNLHQQPRQRSAIRSVTWPQHNVKFNARYIQYAIWIVLAFLLLNLATGRAQVWIDDLRYGRPRTMQMSAYVGHNERPGQPSHFIALNLNRRVTVIELPGGDSTKTQTLEGPYLFGANEDLTPVILRVQDVNADARNDLVIAVKNEEIMYINAGDTFRLITDEERQQLFGEQQ